MTPKQQENLAAKRTDYEGKQKVARTRSQAETVLMVLAENPEQWFFTWELMGSTKWGWLSHATHATLRILEQDGKIIKDYIGKFVVYSAKPSADGSPRKVHKI